MRAVRFVGVGYPAQITDVAKPAPGPGQVLIKIGGAGVCHSDLHLMQEDFGFSGTFTLGHENAGGVAQLGEGVTGFKEGDAVAVYGPIGCGRCHACQQSTENYCENWAAIGAFGGGLGFDGGMAEYTLVPSARLLVPLGGLNPAKAAPLSDAALTPYHAIKRALPQLNADATVVVVGVGGLGHMAVQLVRVLAPVRIIAADVDATKLEQAKALGADREQQRRRPQLKAAAAAGRKTGMYASEVAAMLLPHFEEEEACALPPLGVLKPLARNEPLDDARCSRQSRWPSDFDMNTAR